MWLAVNELTLFNINSNKQFVIVTFSGLVSRR